MFPGRLPHIGFSIKNKEHPLFRVLHISLPDHLSVSEYLSYSVIGNCVNRSIIIFHLKEEVILFGKSQLLEGDNDNFIFHAVVIPYLELPPEMYIPLDSVKDVLNWYHLELSYINYPSVSEIFQ